MKVVDKYKPSELRAEGITPEYLKSINMVSAYSPVVLNVGDEPSILMKCNDGYWVRDRHSEKYLKDEKGKYIVITEREARIGRARYLLNFQDEIYNQRVQSEYNELKNQTIEKAKKVLHEMGLCRAYAGFKGKDIGGDLFDVLVSLDKSPDKEKKVAYAKELWSESAIQLYENLKFLVEESEDNEEKYDTLYIMLFQEGMPMIGSFNHNNPNDMDALVKNMHIDKLEETFERIRTKSHLYNVAKINVDKKYG